MEQIHCSELYAAISQFVQVGFIEGVRALDPTRDLVRKGEIGRWLKLNYADEATFRRLEKAGKIKARPSGPARNSPLVYSIKEIKEAFATLNVVGLIEKYRGHFAG